MFAHGYYDSGVEGPEKKTKEYEPDCPCTNRSWCAGTRRGEERGILKGRQSNRQTDKPSSSSISEYNGLVIHANGSIAYDTLSCPTASCCLTNFSTASSHSFSLNPSSATFLSNPYSNNQPCIHSIQAYHIERRLLQARRMPLVLTLAHTDYVSWSLGTISAERFYAYFISNQLSLQK